MLNLSLLRARVAAWMQGRLALAPDDLMRDRAYRRLWSSILISSLGGQVTMLALPLTAAVLLAATPTQMGVLVAMEIAPFVLLSLPAGVWLDRVRKLPVYVVGEASIALIVTSVPLAWWLGVLAMPWMYVVAFVMGSVHVVAGSAAQIVLTQVVPRERLVEAHARNALASSGAEVVGPGLAGALIKMVGAPVALLVDGAMLVGSVLILRGIHVRERLMPRHDTHFWRDLKAGVRFVRGTPLLVAMAVAVGLWQMCHHAAVVVQILFATRTLGLSESEIGLAFVGLGVGTVLASVFGHRLSSRIGPGPSLLLGQAVCGLGWGLLAMAPRGPLGHLLFALMLMLFGVGAVLIFINFLSLRQAVTPAPLLGRMTSTMRWLILLPAGPGALIGGWLGEHVDLRAALAFAGVGAVAVALAAWRHPLLRGVRELPKLDDGEAELGAEAAVPAPAA
ncbi:MAG TPA: MFS transporter [Burkholderiaceae bacterium]|nr:MFS transporter [Burkholderiaceae bacterium]